MRRSQRHWRGYGASEADQWLTMYSDQPASTSSGDIPTSPTGAYDFNANLQPQGTSAVDVTLGATSTLARVLGAKSAAKAPASGPSFFDTLKADPMRLVMLGLGGLLLVGGAFLALKKPARRMAAYRRRRR